MMARLGSLQYLQNPIKAALHLDLEIRSNVSNESIVSDFYAVKTTID